MKNDDWEELLKPVEILRACHDAFNQIVNIDPIDYKKLLKIYNYWKRNHVSLLRQGQEY